jgi:oligoribonuclease NrnB/cAMP/cGMP phosphodiesterase (DHH superfamily)
MAKKLGGGGHKKAAGFTLEATLEDNILVWRGQTWSPVEFAKSILSL